MKIAFVGTGKIAQRHLAVLTTLPDMEIVGHTSPTPAHVDVLLPDGVVVVTQSWMH